MNRLIDAARYEEALRRLDVAAANDAEPAMLADTRGVVLVGLQDYAAAAANFEQAVTAKQRGSATLGRLAFTYARLGRWDEAEALRDELQQRAESERVPEMTMAIVQIGFGDTDAAIASIQRAAEFGGPGDYRNPVQHVLRRPA